MLDGSSQEEVVSEVAVEGVEEVEDEVAEVDGCSQVVVDSGGGFTWRDEECLSLWPPQPQPPLSFPSPRSMTPAKAGAAKARRARVRLTMLNERGIIAIPRTQR